MQNRPNQIEFICRAFGPKDTSRLILAINETIKYYNKIHPEAALKTEEIEKIIQQNSWHELLSLNLSELQILREIFFQLAEFLAEEYPRSENKINNTLLTDIPHKDSDILRLTVLAASNKIAMGSLYDAYFKYFTEIADFVKFLDRIEKYRKSNRVGVPEAIDSFLDAYNKFNIEECCRLLSDMDDTTWEKCLGEVKSLHSEIDHAIEEHNRVFKEDLETYQQKYSDAEKKIQGNPDSPADFIKHIKILETQINKNLEKSYNLFLNTNKRISEMASLINHRHKEFDEPLLDAFKQFKWKIENKQLYLIWLIDKLIADIQTRNPNSDKVNQLQGIKIKVEKTEGSFKSLLKEIESVCSKRQFFLDLRQPKSLVLFESLEIKRLEAEIEVLKNLKLALKQMDGGPCL